MNHNKYSTVTFIILATVLTACGGGSSSPTETANTGGGGNTPATPAIQTGQFIDAAVQGLQYQTASQSGTTNENGEFSYQVGESITFTLGGIEFPTVNAKAQLTPLDIFQTTDTNNLAVVNMLRLLQSLDTDGMPDNGITLADNIHTLAADLDVNFIDNNFETLLSNLLIINNGINTSLISAEQAIQHFEDTLMISSMPTPPPIVSNCGSDHQKVGYSGNFQTLQHNVNGTATIIDNCTIQITNFDYDASAPAVYFYADSSDSFTMAPFIIGDELRNNRMDYVNDSITITLPSNKSLDDFNYLSVWCVDFSINFGDLTFTP
jgi:hypothetical protein